ncbi:MAG: thioredoxin family protein, partial [Anaerolineae bacterium]|nr:thioredoxin family protein [Anaerolineae bacterium]
MRRFGKWILTSLVFCLMVAGVAMPQTVTVAFGDNVVHGILFYSPTCPHCHEVMVNVLPSLREQYGEKLVIAEVDTSTAAGGAVWQAAVTYYNPPVVGVPTLVIGDQVLVGSLEIPQKLPGYIDTYLAEGGVPWPNLPGIEAVVGDAAPAPLTFWEQLQERYTRDLAGNVLSTV